MKNRFCKGQIAVTNKEDLRKKRTNGSVDYVLMRIVTMSMLSDNVDEGQGGTDQVCYERTGQRPTD